MRTTISLHGKTVRVEISDAAQRMLQKRDRPLMAEVNLIFGCMLAKRVWFRDEIHPEAIAVVKGLSAFFRPVSYAKTCSFDDIDSGAVAADYAMVADKKHFTPDALSIDYRAGKFVGDFTYSRDLMRELNGENLEYAGQPLQIT
ncbi:MAG: hypothetical protein ACYDDO_02960 [Acidiferrobacterales bacterium]